MPGILPQSSPVAGGYRGNGGPPSKPDPSGGLRLNCFERRVRVSMLQIELIPEIKTAARFARADLEHRRLFRAQQVRRDQSGAGHSRLSPGITSPLLPRGKSWRGSRPSPGPPENLPRGNEFLGRRSNRQQFASFKKFHPGNRRYGLDPGYLTPQLRFAELLQRRVGRIPMTPKVRAILKMRLDDRPATSGRPARDPKPTH